MMHDMESVYWTDEGRRKGYPHRPHLRLKAAVDPLSALITLADILQEFERPVCKFLRDGSDNISLSYDHSCVGSSAAVSPRGEMTLEFRMSDRSALAVKRSPLSREQTGHFHPASGYLDLRGWGVREVRMRARL